MGKHSIYFWLFVFPNLNFASLFSQGNTFVMYQALPNPNIEDIVEDPCSPKCDKAKEGLV